MGGGESHNSNVARTGASLDILGSMLPDKINPNTYLTPIADKSNALMSKVTKPVNQFNTKITPGKAYIDNNVPILKAWNQTVENRPVDAMALAAGAMFGGGALMGAGAAGAGGSAAVGMPALSSAGATSAVGLSGASGLAASPAISVMSTGGLSSILGGMSTMQKARLANSLLNYAQQQGTRR